MIGIQETRTPLVSVTALSVERYFGRTSRSRESIREDLSEIPLAAKRRPASSRVWLPRPQRIVGRIAPLMPSVIQRRTKMTFSSMPIVTRSVGT